MKKTIRLGLLLMFAFTAFSASLLAQDNKKEMQDVAKKYEQAYNKKDGKAIKAMYTKDATKTDSDGTVQVGSEAIRAAYAMDFDEIDSLTITISIDKADTATNGTVIATGGYEIKGKLKKSGDPIDAKGTYTNTMVKEDGKWKISKSVLASM